MEFVKANESDFLLIGADQGPPRCLQALPVVLMAVQKPTTVVTKKPK